MIMSDLGANNHFKGGLGTVGSHKDPLRVLTRSGKSQSPYWARDVYNNYFYFNIYSY